MSRAALERTALALLAAGALVAWLRWPVAPTFDSAWSLVWGRQILDGDAPSFDAFRAPTEHPLWVLVSTLLAPLGPAAAARALTAVTVASFVALVAGLYRFGAAAFGPLCGALAAALLLTRLDFGFLAAVGFVDVPFLALLVWAAALETARPRRGGAVLVLLVLAGLLRPEAWLYLWVYAAWLGRRAPGRERWRLAGVALAPIALWALTDLLATGNPVFSFTETTDAADRLAATRELWQLPGSLLSAFDELLKLPVLVAGVVGLALAWRLAPRAALRVPLAVLALGVASFLLTSATGFAVIPRYLAFGTLPVLLFAAYALVGWLDLPRAGTARRRWAVAAGIAVVLGGTWTATHVHPASVTSKLAQRVRIEDDLEAALDGRAVRAARRCGPVSVPNHKLVPLALLDLDARPGAVVARVDPAVQARVRRGGAALYLAGGFGLLRLPAYGVLGERYRFDDSRLALVPLPGYLPAARNRSFAVYTRC